MTRRRDGPGPPRNRTRPTAPAILDPILAAWERFDRRRRGIRPVRQGALFGLELVRHRRASVHLADGTEIEHGDLVGEIHLDNRLVRAAVAQAGWLRAFGTARRDLDALAAWSKRQPEPNRPVAYHGSTLVWPFAARVGFQVVPRRRTAYVRLDEWFLRWLMVHWSPAGRDRLAAGHSALESAEVWLSRSALEERLDPVRTLACPRP